MQFYCAIHPTTYAQLKKWGLFAYFVSIIKRIVKLLVDKIM